MTDTEINFETFHKIHKKTIPNDMKYEQAIREMDKIRLFDKEKMIKIFNTGDPVGIENPYRYVAIMANPVPILSSIMEHWDLRMVGNNQEITSFNDFYTVLAIKMRCSMMRGELVVNYHPPNKEAGCVVTLNNPGFDFDYVKDIKKLGNMPVEFNNLVCNDTSDHHCVRPILKLIINNFGIVRTTDTYYFFMTNKYEEIETQVLQDILVGRSLEDSNSIIENCIHYIRTCGTSDMKSLITPDGVIVHIKTHGGFTEKAPTTLEEQINNFSSLKKNKKPGDNLKKHSEKEIDDSDIHIPKNYQDLQTKLFAEPIQMCDLYFLSCIFNMKHFTRLSPIIWSCIICNNIAPSLLSVILCYNDIIDDCRTFYGSNNGDISTFCIYIDRDAKLWSKKPTVIQTKKLPLRVALQWCIQMEAEKFQKQIHRFNYISHFIRGSTNLEAEDERLFFSMVLGYQKQIEEWEIILGWLKNTKNVY